MPLQYSENHNKHGVFLYTIPAQPRLSTWQYEWMQDFTAKNPILVTDDDPMSRALHRAIFEQHGLTIIETRSSVDALDVCLQQPISLIISDIMKPQMDGLVMLQNLRSDPRTNHIPLIFVTAANRIQDTAFEFGADSFIRKPFHPQVLLREVWRLLSKRIK